MLPTSETTLWQSHLATHQAALAAGKPDAVRALAAEARRLQAERAAYAARLLVAEASRATLVAGTLRRAILGLDTRLADLGALTFTRAPQPQDSGPTPEVLARPAQRDPVWVLEQAEVERPGTGLTPEQAQAARMVARIHEAIARAGKAKVGRLEQGSGGGDAQGSGMPDWLDELRHRAYIPWAVAQPADALAVTLAICVYGVSISSVRRKYGRGYAWVVGTLRGSLDQFAQHRRRA